jgi:hypothetical protein
VSDRCIQCGWTVPDRKRELVVRGDKELLLHKGGCPDLIGRQVDDGEAEEP